MRTVLITGASSGIGEACALRLDGHGWRVFGTVRNQQDADALRAKTGGRATPMIMDLTDPPSITAAASSVTEAVGAEGLAGLINNAGIAVGGPIELLPIDDLRHQLEVNLFGQVVLTQALIPTLRKAHGRMVFISSIAGRVAFPYQSPYSISKFALEALAEALRVELRPWQMHTAIIEPGSIDTPIWRKGQQQARTLLAGLNEPLPDAYWRPMKGVGGITRRAIKMGVPPDRVARAVEHALTARWPRSRYLVGWDARLLVMLEALPDPLRDWLIRMVLAYYAR